MKTMRRFRLSTRAQADLADVHHYIAADNVSAADKFIEGLFSLFHLLAESPGIGQERSDLRPNLRTISHGKYVVLFYAMRDGVEIVGVVHGARDIEALFRTDEH
jgi:toxin ParE1/3/4